MTLVSPGGANQSTLAAPCPTFSWAPGDAVAAYELAVFEVDASKTPKATPILHVAVAGGASSWTPPSTNCLTPGQEFAWFLREFRRVGDQPGKWSAGMAFSVTDAAVGSLAKDDNPGQGGGGGNGGGTGTGNPNADILTRLDDLEAKLDQLLNPGPRSRALCVERGIELELGIDGELKLAGGADASAGAKAAGNGALAYIKANGEAKLASGLKGAGALKWADCWDRTDKIGGASTTVAGARLATASATGPMSDAEFETRLQAIADELQFDDDRLRALLDVIPNFSVGVDPWGGLRANSPFETLVDILPMPAAARSTLRDPSQVIANFRDQINLCTQPNLPAAVAGLVDEFCELIGGDRFTQLLERVDSVVQNVKGTMDNVKGTVDSTRTAVTTINNNVNSLRNKVDDFYCKFFCGPN